MTLYSGQSVAQSANSVVITFTAGAGEVERRVDDAGLHALGDAGVQRRLAGAAGERHEVAVVDAAVLGVPGVDLEHVLVVPDDVGGAARLGADVVLR